jgi:hypothetical protein
MTIASGNHNVLQGTDQSSLQQRENEKNVNENAKIDVKICDFGTSQVGVIRHSYRPLSPPYTPPGVNLCEHLCLLWRNENADTDNFLVTV